MAKENKNSDKTSTEQRKLRAMFEEFQKIPLGDKITLTNLAKRIRYKNRNNKEKGLHPNSLRDYLDFYTNLQELGIKIDRNGDGIIKFITREDVETDKEVLDKILKNTEKILEKR